MYGTLETPGLHGSPNATFSIDSQPPVHFNTSGSVQLDNPYIVTSHVLLYQSPGLNKGTHTLSIETLNPTASLYIDFFTVSTGSDSASGYIIVDDRDPSIVYTGVWPDAGASSEYLDTTRQSPSDSNGGSATIRFNGACIVLISVSLRPPKGLIPRYRNERDCLRHDTDHRRGGYGSKNRVRCRWYERRKLHRPVKLADPSTYCFHSRGGALGYRRALHCDEHAHVKRVVSGLYRLQDG